MGYHKVKIKKGIIGQFSKIEEEFNELKDAVEQEDRILQLVELTDLLGAIDSYCFYQLNGFSLEELIKFTRKTQSAFKDGSRE